MPKNPEKRINPLRYLIGAVLLGFLLPVSQGLAETREKKEGRDSFPAAGALQALLIKNEKNLGLIPTALSEEIKFPKGMSPSKEEAAQLAYGEYLLETGMTERAAEVLKKLIGTREKGPFIRMAREALQKAYYRSGRYQDSLEVFYQISSDRKNPAGPGAVLIAGNSYLRNKDYRPALETLALISPDRTHYPFALYSIGLAQSFIEGEGQEDPVWTLKKLVRFNPGDNPETLELLNQARLNLALLLKNRNNFSEALSYLGEIPPESRFYPEALYATGVMLSDTGSFVRAIVVFEDLVAQSPVSPYGLESFYRIGACFSDLKAFRNSVERFHVALNQLEAEKKYLKEVQSRIRGGQPVSLTDIQERFLRGKNTVGPEDEKNWSGRFKEMAQLERRVKRISGMFNGEGQEGSGKVKSLGVYLNEAVEELESRFLDGISGTVSARINWIEDLIQDTTLQLARHIILIQDHETIP